MVVANLAHLDKLDPAAKVVDDFLVALGRPPLNSYIMFSAGADDPIRHSPPCQFADGGETRALGLGEMNVAAELSWLKVYTQPPIEKIHECVEIMACHLAAAVYQRSITS